MEAGGGVRPHPVRPQPPLDEIEGWEWYPDENVRGGEFFLLRVSGDSMAGGARPIQAGDRVLIRRQPDVEDGEIAVVWWIEHNEACLKRVFHQGKNIVLVSDTRTTCLWYSRPGRSASSARWWK